MIDKKPIILSEEKMGQTPEAAMRDNEYAAAPMNYIKPEVIIEIAPEVIVEIAPEIVEDVESKIASANVSNFYQYPDFPPGMIVEVAPEVFQDVQSASVEVTKPIVEISPEVFPPGTIVEIAPEVIKDVESQVASANVSNFYQYPDFPPGMIVEVAPEVVFDKQTAAGSVDPEAQLPIVEIAPEIRV